jgi:hypothetical protein
MKKITLLIFILFSTAYSADLPIMVEIKNNNMHSSFLNGVEEELTNLKFSIVDKKIQEEALEEQRKQRNSDCYDDKCLVDTGKMLAAKAVILIDVGNTNTYPIRFTAKYIDLEKGVTTKTTTLYYSLRLENNINLLNFGKELIDSLFNKKPYHASYIKPKEEESNWNFAIGGNFAVVPKSIEFKENSYGGAGIGLSFNIDLSYNFLRMKDEMTLNMYSEFSYWTIGGAYDYNDGENLDLLLNSYHLNVNVGFEFIFGRKTAPLPLFIRIGLANGYMSYSPTTTDSINKHSFKTFGLQFEIGIDQKLFMNIFDFYMGTVMNLYMYEINDASNKITGGDYPIYMGVRHTF